MNASRAEACLGNGKPPALFTKEIAHGYAHVVKKYFTVAFVILIAKDEQVTLYSDAEGILGYENHALLAMLVGVIRVGFAHDDEDFAAFTHSTGSPPFAPIEDVFIAFAMDGELNVGGVGTGDIWLGHGEGGTDFAIEQGL